MSTITIVGMIVWAVCLLFAERVAVLGLEVENPFLKILAVIGMLLFFGVILSLLGFLGQVLLAPVMWLFGFS